MCVEIEKLEAIEKRYFRFVEGVSEVFSRMCQNPTGTCPLAILEKKYPNHRIPQECPFFYGDSCCDFTSQDEWIDWLTRQGE